MSHNEWYDTQERIHLFVHPSLPVVQQNNSDPDFPQLAKKKNVVSQSAETFRDPTPASVQAQLTCASACSQLPAPGLLIV